MQTTCLRTHLNIFFKNFQRIQKHGLCVPLPQALKQRYSSDVASAVLSTKVPVFKIHLVEYDGAVTSNEVSKAHLCQQLSLSARDIRFQHSNMMWNRNGKIITKLQAIEAVLCQDCLLLMDTTPARSKEVVTFRDDFSSKLKSYSLHTCNLPFEFQGLEAILSYNVSRLSSRLALLEPVITKLLLSLTDPNNQNVDRAKIHLLLNKNAKLSSLETETRDFVSMLNDVLEYDEEIQDLCISAPVNTINRCHSDYDVFVFNAFANEENKHEDKYKINLENEMEFLLESFLKEGEEILHAVSELKQAIENSNTAILINLDSHRNMLLRLEIQLTMGMFSCTLFGMFGMAFGMNLNSSLEENLYAFWIVSGVMFVGAAISFVTLLYYLRKPIDAKPISEKKLMRNRSMRQSSICANQVSLKNNQSQKRINRLLQFFKKFKR